MLEGFGLAILGRLRVSRFKLLERSHMMSLLPFGGVRLLHPSSTRLKIKKCWNLTYFLFLVSKDPLERKMIQKLLYTIRNQLSLISVPFI